MVANDERFQALYDVERHVRATDGTVIEDPYPEFAVLRAQAPVHRGSVAELLGLPDRQRARYGEGPTYSLFSLKANDIALRHNEVFSSGHYVGLTTAMFGRSILEMGGEEHRTYRALVQPALAPRRVQWWMESPLPQRNELDVAPVRNLVKGFRSCSLRRRG